MKNRWFNVASGRRSLDRPEFAVAVAEGGFFGPPAVLGKTTFLGLELACRLAI